MIVSQDWLMRQIEAIVIAITNLLNIAGLSYTSIKQTNEFEQRFKEKILEGIKEGRFCEIENWLCENADENDDVWLKLAVYFYSESNKLTDDYLKTNWFSREEIISGLSRMCKKYGYGDVIDNIVI